MGWGGDDYDLRLWQWEWGGEENLGEVKGVQFIGFSGRVAFGVSFGVQDLFGDGG